MAEWWRWKVNTRCLRPRQRRRRPRTGTRRTSPSPHTARPVSRELPVDPDHDLRWGFPCCLWSPLRTCHRHYPGRFDEACFRSSIFIDCGLPCEKVRSAPAIVFSRPAQRSLALWPARSPSRYTTLYIESSDRFVASAAASIATGWSDPVPGRALSRCGPAPFTAHSNGDVTPAIGWANRREDAYTADAPTVSLVLVWRIDRTSRRFPCQLCSSNPQTLS